MNKGKGKAGPEPTETSPLLQPASSASSSNLTQPPAQRTVLYSRILSVFLFALCLWIIVILILVLFLWPYAAHALHISPEVILDRALILQGPFAVALHPSDEPSLGGLLLTVSGRAGLDSDSIFGLDNVVGLRSSLGRWGVGHIDAVSISANPIHVSSKDDSLASLDVLQSFQLPLSSYSTSPNGSWLKPISLRIRLFPPNNMTLLNLFLQQSWRTGELVVNIQSSAITVDAGGGWRSLFRKRLSNVYISRHLPIPIIPGLPSPGGELPALSDLITLRHFTILSKTQYLGIQARASIIDPIPDSLNLTTPSIPLLFSLPDVNATSVPIASVTASPFTLTHPNITLDVEGRVLPINPSSSPLVSRLLSRYLSGDSNTLLVASPFLPGLSLNAIFPGPNPRPHLLQNVTIKDMKVKAGTPFLASGAVFARLVLPLGMNVALDVKHILPDVMVFDGPVPGDEVREHPAPPPAPLPDPLPERAFGRIRPAEWIASQCLPETPTGDQEHGSSFVISAFFEDVPLDVLPGRESEFSSFVRKVIFSPDGATAGILGTTAVEVVVEGLHQSGGSHAPMLLDGLPFRGKVHVGKGGFFNMAKVASLLHIHW